MDNFYLGVESSMFHKITRRSFIIWKLSNRLIRQLFDFLMVNWNPDQIIFASVGGILLGIATSINYVIRGKVTGMSGIVFGIVSLNKKQMPEKLSIIGGMFLISSIFYLIYGTSYISGFQPFGPENQVAAWTTFPGFALAGFLVGFGTKLSNGCTSGHGLCGVSRFSIRSIVAVGVFLLTAIAFSTFIVYVGLGPFYDDPSLSPEISYNHTASAITFICIGIVLPIIGFAIAKFTETEFDIKNQLLDQAIVFSVGILFAIGLMVSGMSRRQNILEFLQINENWNPALLFVLGCGLIVNVIVFTIMRKRAVSLNGNKVFDPKNSVIDLRLVGGAFCFGLGWGLGGLCPGPFLVLFADFTVPIQVIWGGCLVIGQIIANELGNFLDKRQKQKLESTQTDRNQVAKELIANP